MNFARRIVFVLLIAAPVLGAQQQQVSVDIQLPTGRALTVSDGPMIVASNVLSDTTTREDLHHGFPTKLHYKVELWRKGITDSRESFKEWDVGVLYEPATQVYDVSERIGTRVTVLGHTSTIAEVEALVDKPYALLLGPKQRGERYYYVAQLEVTPVSGNDLDETLRWLNGDFKPAVSGHNLFSGIKNAVLSAVGHLLGKKLTAHGHSAIFIAG